jgi:hypothetical protein
MAPTKGNPRHAFRFKPELWAQFTAAAERDPDGRDQTAVIRDFIRWYVRERGVKLVRPDKAE